MEKLCIECKKLLPVSNFTFITTRSVYVSRCRPCNNSWANEKRRKRGDKYREYQRSKRRKEPARHMLYSTRQSARKEGVEHTLTINDIQMPSHCPILGIPFETGNGYAGDSSPSLDRIDPAKGYVPGNVHVISYKANTMKSNATPEEMQAFAKWILANYP